VIWITASHTCYLPDTCYLPMICNLLFNNIIPFTWGLQLIPERQYFGIIPMSAHPANHKNQQPEKSSL
jgi:hypothetical protein